MSELMWIRSHVELLLQRQWYCTTVRQDEDGDYPFRADSGLCWVSVLDTQPPMVRVFGHAAIGVRPSLKLYRELSEIQKGVLSATVTHSDDLVLVSQTISPIGLTQPVLAQAINSVASITAEIGPLIAAMFGGATPCPSDQSSDWEAS